MKRSILPASALGIAALATPSSAQAPQLVPIRGALEDASGVAVEGSTTIVFSLYSNEVSGTPIFRESQVLVLERGQLYAYLGAAEPLDLALFRDHPAVWLGIQVIGDPEMSPRIRLGAVPYAAYAEHCGDADRVGGETASGLGVPSGAVMFFDLPSCPSGWTELAAARGRAIVGLPSGGASLGTVGTPLTNLEDRAHAHTVDPASVSSSAAGNHTHSVDPPSTTTSANGGHNHPWLSFASAGTPGSPGAVGTYTSTGALTTALFNRVSVAPAGSTNVIGIGGGTAYTAEAADHTHTANVSAFDSASAGAHTHDVDVGPSQSTSATTGQVVPYVQLLACRKG
jgi:hypothetical protein